MKRCFKCGEEKEISEFYKHPEMADGHLGKCKECAKNDVKQNKEKNREYYLNYERERSRMSHRVLSRMEYAETERGIEAHRRARSMYENRNKERIRESKQKYILNNQEKRNAHIILRNAIRAKKVEQKTCEICGNINVHGHHEDYNRPLDVCWLCPKHHKMFHKARRDVSIILENITEMVSVN